MTACSLLERGSWAVKPSAVCGTRRIFERLLHNTFVLRKALEARSARLYKEANPFAYSTIKDWVVLLAQTGDRGDAPAAPHEPEAVASLSARGFTPSIKTHIRSSRSKHPWELDGADLLVDEVIGTGTQGAVYCGSYKGIPVAIKTL